MCLPNAGKEVWKGIVRCFYCRSLESEVLSQKKGSEGDEEEEEIQEPWEEDSLGSKYAMTGVG